MIHQQQSIIKHKALYLHALIAMVALIISLNSLAETRPASPTTTISHRKPPFNGSIFGKRSGGPPIRATTGPAASVAKRDFDPLSYLTETPLELLVSMERQREYLIAAATSQCLNGQNYIIDFDTSSAEICSQLLAGNKFYGGRNQLENLLNQVPV